MPFSGRVHVVPLSEASAVSIKGKPESHLSSAFGIQMDIDFGQRAGREAPKSAQPEKHGYRRSPDTVVSGREQNGMPKSTPNDSLV
jgi:hypothetical protein